MFASAPDLSQRQSKVEIPDEWRQISSGTTGSDTDDLAQWRRRLGDERLNALFDGGRIRRRIDVQDAVREQALLNDKQTVLAALGEVEDALSVYATGRQLGDIGQ
jgi:outer membrane protein TolC